MGADEVVFELEREALTAGYGLGGDVEGGGEGGEETEEGEGIVEVAEGVDEGGVALFDHMVERQSRGEVLLESSSIGELVATQGFADLLGDALLLPEFGEERFM